MPLSLGHSGMYGPYAGTGGSSPQVSSGKLALTCISSRHVSIITPRIGPPQCGGMQLQEGQDRAPPPCLASQETAAKCGFLTCA